MSRKHLPAGSLPRRSRSSREIGLSPYWVRCPGCGGVGFVARRTVARGTNSYHFRCPHCAHALDSLSRQTTMPYPRTEIGQWLGPVMGHGARPNCGHCGRRTRLAIRLRRTVQERQSLPKSWPVICAQCGVVTDLELEWYCDIDPVAGSDPCFGLPLALSEPLRRGCNVWALNPAHLTELKAFVMAGLRENDRHFHSFYARLPAWMKIAKNRDKVLAAIGRIERRLLQGGKRDV